MKTGASRTANVQECVAVTSRVGECGLGGVIEQTTWFKKNEYYAMYGIQENWRA